MSDSTKPVTDQYTLQADLSAANDPQSTQTVDGPIDENEEKPQSMGWMMVRELVETVVLSLLIFLAIRQVVQNYRIENHSMEPSFYEGQFVLVNKLAFRLGQPERGDVVVFHNPSNTNEDYIKRIIGLPGDQVEIRNQTVYINGQSLLEDYPHAPIPMNDYVPPTVVPDDQMFVMGDNRPNSSDSRYFGPINQDLVVGKAWLRIWPLDVFGIVSHEDLGIGEVAPVGADASG